MTHDILQFTIFIFASVLVYRHTYVEREEGRLMIRIGSQTSNITFNWGK